MKRRSFAARIKGLRRGLRFMGAKPGPDAIIRDAAEGRTVAPQELQMAVAEVQKREKNWHRRAKAHAARTADYEQMGSFRDNILCAEDEKELSYLAEALEKQPAMSAGTKRKCLKAIEARRCSLRDQAQQSA
jgi:hypothetical protein